MDKKQFGACSKHANDVLPIRRSYGTGIVAFIVGVMALTLAYERYDNAFGNRTLYVVIGVNIAVALIVGGLLIRFAIKSGNPTEFFKWYAVRDIIVFLGLSAMMYRPTSWTLLLIFVLAVFYFYRIRDEFGYIIHRRKNPVVKPG